MRRILLLFAAWVVPLPLASQNKVPERPKLPRDLDTLDARAYYEWGIRRDVNWKKAHAAFYWASRLEPNDFSYVGATADGLLYRQSPQWRAEYWNGAEYVTKSKEAKRIDSAYAAVYLQNPFYGRSSRCVLMPDLQLSHKRDRLYVATVHYANGCYGRAVTAYDEALAKDSSLLGVYVYRAKALYYLRRWSDAVQSIQVVLDSLRARDAKYLVRFYESKAYYEYMIGMVYWRAHRNPEARAAFGRALTEDLSYYPAHARLGDISLNEGKLQSAATEYGLAIELNPDKGILYYYQGDALRRMRMYEQAEHAEREAVRLEPYWAQPYYELGLALEGEEKFAEAATAFEDFLARCPRRLKVEADEVREHLQSAVEKAAGGPPRQPRH